jgi:SAM-dependent methyltransferase
MNRATLRSTGRSLARRLIDSRAGSRMVAAIREGEGEVRIDDWLVPCFGERLGELDRACAGDSFSFEAFRDLDDELWAMLLSRQYRTYPNILARLPELPEPALQRRWNGTSGLALAAQSARFYSAVKELYGRRGERELAASRVLDFGCGWGRLTRFFARDLAPDRLFGCDPVDDILEVCRRTGVPATLARSEFVPDRLPFDGPFDLVYAFSVFTHLSELAHESCLRAIHASLGAGGVLIVTIRPPAYLTSNELMRPLIADLGPDLLASLREPRYLFVPHAAEPDHPQYGGEEMTYGETVITLPYVRQRWRHLFELTDVRLLLGDPHQLVLALRRQG